MSVDLYLLPLQLDDDFETAMTLHAALDRSDPDYAYALDAREAARVILELDSRYERFQISVDEAKKYAGTPTGDAWLKLMSEAVQLNGKSEDGQPLAQFHFSRYHIAIHWYSGTSSDEMDRYLIVLCSATGLAVVDPQTYAVWRLREDGTLE
jgi:hypothetical protein